MTTSIFSIVAILIACVIGAFGALYLKKGAGDFSFNLKKLIKNKNLIKGFFFYAVSTVIFIPSLKYGDLSVLYPLVSTAYAWTIILCQGQ